MARYTGPVCRLCRRDGTKLFLKGAKCFSEKCPIEKRNFPPGQHGQSRKVKKVVGYGLQLREKQKAKRIYFTLETQFRAYYQKAANKTGVTGELLQKQFAGDARGARGLLVVGAELPLEGEVNTLRLLLLAKLQAVANDLGFTIAAMLAGGEITLLDRALVGEALGPFQEKLHAFATAKAADRSGITCQFNSPNLRGRPVYG